MSEHTFWLTIKIINDFLLKTYFEHRHCFLQRMIDLFVTVAVPVVVTEEHTILNLICS